MVLSSLLTKMILYDGNNNEVFFEFRTDRSEVYNIIFLRYYFDAEKVYPWYFYYQFSEEKGFGQQIEMYHQGTTLSVKKLNIKTIGELKIFLPDIEKQKTIGNIYRQSIIQNDLMIKRAEDIRKYTMTLLRRMEDN